MHIYKVKIEVNITILIPDHEKDTSKLKGMSAASTALTSPEGILPLEAI